MKPEPYRSRGIGAAVATALVALLAGVSTGSAQPVAAKRAGPAEQVVNVTLQRGGIGYTPSHLATGRHDAGRAQRPPRGPSPSSSSATAAA